MSAVREIRRRLRSIKNIAKMTNAMQMVASSKLRGAVQRMQQSRSYTERIGRLVSHLAQAVGEDRGKGMEFLRQRPVRTVAIILMTPDHHLCGALPSAINRKAMTIALEQQRRLAQQWPGPAVSFIAVGRRGRDFLVRAGRHLLAEFINYGNKPGFQDAATIAQVVVDAFLKGEVDVVFLVYAQFINSVSQQPVVLQLLPVQPPLEERRTPQHTEYIYESDPGKVFEALLPRYVDVQVYQALLETVASELSAQMVAMKQATDNANELVQDLTLAMNKARQASITTQILEVVAGANSLV